ncbi:MAG: carbohydrate ABC transporter permease, partial [Mesorhizobium sp.]
MADLAVPLPAGTGSIGLEASGPRGPKPRHVFSRRNIFLYG